MNMENWMVSVSFSVPQTEQVGHGCCGKISKGFVLEIEHFVCLRLCFDMMQIQSKEGSRK